MNYWWLLTIVAYLIGSFPTGRFVGSLAGHDPTKEGSKNPGATNVYRVAGYQAGAAVLIFDIIKGVIPVLVAVLVSQRDVAVICSACCVVGHIFPIFSGFKRGGKGVATFEGVSLPLNPIPALVALGVWVLVFVLRIKKPMERSSFAALIAMPALLVATILIGRPALEIWVCAGLVVLSTIMHRKNILRIINSFGKNNNKE